MQRNFAIGLRARNTGRPIQACHPKTASARAANAHRSLAEEAQQLREELARVRQELSELRAATSTFVRGLM